MNLEKYNLKNKNALITGAAGLLGFEHAAALIECGANVVLTDINEVTLNQTKYELEKSFLSKNNTNKSKIYSKILNVANSEEVILVAKDLEREGISIDILINNAAIDPKVRLNQGVLESSRLENLTTDQWDLQLAVGLKGAFLCSQVFGAAMAENKRGGVILNIASDLSIISPDQRLYHKKGLPDHLQPVKPITYSVIKAGLIGMTRYISTYWAEKGIRCNALSPGGIYSDQDKEFVQRLSSLIPLGRMARRDEYRSAVQFLCSEASSYMNGQNIVIDGGRSVL